MTTGINYSARWAAQVVTFYDPAHWGKASSAELLDWVNAHPRDFWDQLLTQAGDCGVSSLELCFEPGDWRTLRAAYGDSAEVRRALTSAGLGLTGSYQGGGHRLEQALTDRRTAAALVDEMTEHATFVREIGGATVMMGPPRRFQTIGDYQSPLPADLVKQLGRVLDAIGETVRSQGLGFALHTEAYSCFCREKDALDILAVTDPELVSCCADTGHITLDGGDAAHFVASIGTRVSNVHAKDSIGPRAELPADGEVSHEMMMEQFRRLGEGIVRWDDVNAELGRAGFRGTYAIEHDLAPNPVADVRQALAYVHAVTKGTKL